MPLEPLADADAAHGARVAVGRQRPAVATVPRRPGDRATHAQWSDYPDLVPFGVVPHGVDPDVFVYADGGSSARYLGRFVPGKGPVEAVAAAGPPTSTS